MLTLNDGRSELWQWDTGRKLTVDAECSQVHFSNKVFGRSIDVDVVDGMAIIPDVLLQTDKDLTAWAFVGTPENGYTKISKVFKVNKRNKPSDYVFTPPEQVTLAGLVARLDAIEESQDPDAIKNAVDEYLKQNPVDFPVDSVNGKFGDVNLSAEDVDALPKDASVVKTVNGTSPDSNGNVEITIPDSGGNVDLEGYATEQWVKDQNYLTDVPDGYAKTEDIPKKPEDIGAQPSGNYALKSEIPSVPTKISAFTNDTGYLTKHQDISGKANVSDVFEYTENPAFTNLFDTVEIEYRKMINMTDKTVEDTTANLATTGYIPVKAGDVIRVNEDFPLYNTGSTAYILYDANKNALQSFRLNAIVEGSYYVSLLEADSNGYVTACQINKPSSVAFIRICNNTTVVGRNPVLTVNEEIDYEMGYGKKLNPNVKVDHSQIVNAPSRHGWNILPYERLNIAYSSIGRKPINTVEHFTDAAENFGYNVLKCDVRPTSDGELVCCHDAGFTFNSSGKITTYDSANATAIRSVTAATVLGYSFPTGEHPCLVGDYLDICRKYGKIAFVTIRNEYMDVVVPKLLEELRAHNMTYSAIINCMAYESLVQWRQQDTSVMINYTLNAGVAIDQTQIDRAIGLGYCSLCGFGLTSSATAPNHTCDFEYARANGIRLLQAIAYKDGSLEACYAMGYDGCQIGIPWNPVDVPVDAYTRAETDNLIATAIGGAIGGSY